MPATPNWQGATANNPGLAAQANQFLGSHASTILYQGALQDNQLTVGSGSATTNGSYLAQKFTTTVGQTTVGVVGIRLLNTTSPAPTTLSVYASAAGAPTGSPLVTTAITPEYVSFAPTVIIVPVPISTLTASTVYFLVTSPAGTSGSACFSWNKSNQVTGAYTSTNGTTWTSQAYGLVYEIFDQTVVGNFTSTWEDNGARWTWLNYNAAGAISQLTEYTTAQASSYIQSNRNLTYSNTVPIGVA